MATKRNKKYRPKYLPGTLPVIFGLAKEKKTDLRLPYHISLDALRMARGRWTTRTRSFPRC